jgi:phytoene desaturase
LKKQAIIIGSGIAGLATAVRLACAGYKVTVFESNAYPGGKLSQFCINDFRFDAGPSLLATPALIEDLFLLAGEDPRKFFKYNKIDKSCIYFYPDGSQFTAWHDRTKFAQELKQKFNITDPSPVFKYLKKAEKDYQATAPVFLEQSLHRLFNYFNIKTLKALFHSPRLNLLKSMNKVNEEAFSDPRLVQYFNRFATYNGSNPYSAPGLLTVIAHLEHSFGTFIPEGGMYSITDCIYQLALRKGVEFKFNSPVQKIEISENKACGVVANGQHYKADLLVSNSDIYNTYKKLLPDLKAPEKTLNQEKSSSALIFYWAINREFQELDLHNIFFSNNYKEEFDFIFLKKDLFDDPTVYVNITSKYVKKDARAGCENWFVMINVPNNVGQDWDQLIAKAKKNILRKLSENLQTDIEPLICAEQILDPRTIESNTGSYLGALYGNASNNRFAAFLRHKNFSDKIKGLYFCGGSVHPGGGIPLCLNSAKIVSDLVKQDMK